MQSACRLFRNRRLRYRRLICLGVFLGFGFCFAHPQTPSAPANKSIHAEENPTEGKISKSEIERLRPAVLPDLRALMARVENDNPSPADVDEEFRHCEFTLFKLGKLGAAVLVEAQPGHGKSNAAMLNLYVPSHGTFRRILAAEGFGPEIISGSKPVPDLVFGWSAGVCHTTFYRYHYEHGKYVADACIQEEDAGRDSEDCSIRACEGKLPTFRHR
jgi:hypothetical protein